MSNDGQLRVHSRAATGLAFLVGCTATLFWALVVSTSTQPPEAWPLRAAMAAPWLVPPALVVRWLVRQDPPHPRDLAVVFLWGALGGIPIFTVAAALVSVVAPLLGAAPILGPDHTARHAGPVLEEVAKVLGVLWLMRRRRSTRPRDGLALGAFAGLGFAWMEASLVTLRFSPEEAVWANLERGVAGILGGGHALYSAVTGLGIGIARSQEPGPRRALTLGAALTVAVVAHTVWNHLPPVLWPEYRDLGFRLIVEIPINVLLIHGPVAAAIAFALRTVVEPPAPEGTHPGDGSPHSPPTLV